VAEREVILPLHGSTPGPTGSGSRLGPRPVQEFARGESGPSGGQPSGPGEATPKAEPPLDPFTAMTGRFGALERAFGRRFFRDFQFEPGSDEDLRELDQRGAVVYVMRYSSRLDYFLFNWLFLAADVRLSSFANGIRFSFYRPMLQAVSLLFRGGLLRLRLGRRGMRARSVDLAAEVVRKGESSFLFLRTDKVRTALRPRRRAVESARSEIEYLRRVVDTTFEHDVPVSLVPLALFWRKGARPRRRFLNIFYGGPERPTDTGKVLAFLWNYRHLAVRVGTPIDLRRFVADRRESGPAKVTRQVHRSVLIFLRREEKPVLGAALRPLDRIESSVLAIPSVRRAIADAAVSEGRSQARIEARARRLLAEIAASPSPTALAVLDVIVGWIFARLFARVEVQGLSEVVEAAKLRPLILVPSHRSHFDYLILSWLFYEHHLVPPLVAAGINLAFWPLGPIFRRAGGYFMRRSFDGDKLYSAVFRGYVQLLMKDGITQEFFIEGTRSRTGKTLQPRLGMVSMMLDAFSRGVRRDVVVVPVGFTYERLVEEGSMTEERRGATKRSESLLQLIRARSVLRRSFGSVTVRFGEPISLEEVWPRDAPDPASESDERTALLRRVTVELGNDISRRINGLITAGRSSVSAAALLGGGGRGARVPDFCERVRELATLLDEAGLARSGNLERNLSMDRPEAAAELLVQSGLVTRREGPSGTVLEFPESARDVLAYYRATIAPALAPAAALAISLSAPGPRPASESEVLTLAADWLELLRLEYFPAPAAERRDLLRRLFVHMESRGWILRGVDGIGPSESGVGWLRFLANQVRPTLETYRSVFDVVTGLDAPLKRKELVESARKVLGDQLVLGEALCPEADCPITAGNALSLLIEEDVLECDGNPRLPDAELRRAPGEPRLEELRAALAQGLASR